MNNLNLATIESVNNKFVISMPFAKVNKEKRTVSGFATLDNVDRHGDIVTKEASKKAFDNFRKNIREMHGPVAVGKMIDFKEDSFFDKETGKKYNGVYVTAYISKGAQDAWEKCLDGTYSGFSIGGNIIDAKMEKSDDSSETRRVIHNYDLHELSLVDSPANQLANFMSIEKNIDGSSFIKGMISETALENVFWCDTDEVTSTSSEISKECVVCDRQMTNVGWVEQADVEKFEAIEKVIDSYFKKDDAPTSNHEATESAAPGNVVDSSTTINLYPDQNKVKTVSPIDITSAIKKNEGANEMTEETNTEVTTEVTEVEAPAAEETAVAVEEASEFTGEEIEKAVAISEVEDTLDFSKMVGDLKTFFNDSIEKNYSNQSASIRDVVKMVQDAKEEMTKSIDDIKAKNEELTKTITDMYGKIEYVDHQLKGFESATAVKKSSDLNGSMEETQIQKSIWQGHFLGVNSLTK
jgi:Putative phage serine protease XkdF